MFKFPNAYLKKCRDTFNKLRQFQTRDTFQILWDNNEILPLFLDDRLLGEGRRPIRVVGVTKGLNGKEYNGQPALLSLINELLDDGSYEGTGEHSELEKLLSEGKAEWERYKSEDDLELLVTPDPVPPSPTPDDYKSENYLRYINALSFILCCLLGISVLHLEFNIEFDGAAV